MGSSVNDICECFPGTCTWERVAASGIRPHPRSQCCAFTAPSLASRSLRFNSGYSSLGGASSSSGSSGSTGSSGYSSTRSASNFRSQRRSNRYQNPKHIDNPNKVCKCSDCIILSEMEELDEDLPEPSLPVDLHEPLNKRLARISQLNIGNIGKYSNYRMLNNDSTESIADESNASTCESFVNKLGRSRSFLGIHNAAAEIEDVETPTRGMSRDIVSVPNFADFVENKVITVKPADTCLELDDIQDIKGRLVFRDLPMSENHSDNLMSTDTSVSDNLMSFSTTENSLHSYTNGDNSYTNPNYVGLNPDGDGGLLSHDYWSKGALDLENVRHREYAEVLKTPPDSGIGLGIELDNRVSTDITALEEFVSLNKKVSHLTRTPGRSVEIPAGYRVPGCMLTDSRKEKFSHSTSRVTFCTEPISLSSPKMQSKVNHNIPEKSQLKGRPLVKPEPQVIPDGPSAMYIIGGKEIDQMTIFKRPISLWKFDLTY